MSSHALKGAAAGVAGGLAILAFGIPILAPVALIAGLAAGIYKDNEEHRRARQRNVHEDEESNEEDYVESSYNRRRISSEIASILQRLNERDQRPQYQPRRMADMDFNFTPFRTENEDDDRPRFINNNHEERRPRRQADNTNEPSLRNEEYFRRHNRQ